MDVSVTSRHDAQTGVQRAVRGILLHLLLAPPAGYDVIPVRAGRWRSYRYVCEYATRLGRPVTSFTGKVRASAGDIFLALDLTSSILPRHEAQLAKWRDASVRIVFFVHDLLPHLHPDWFTEKGARNYARWIRCLAAYADDAICTTRFVADALRRWLSEHAPQAARRISVATVPLGADVAGSRPSSGLPSGFDGLLSRMRARPLVLMVGTIEPRKGYAQALSAFELLWRQGREVNLVIVGRVGWNVEEVVSRLGTHPQAGERLYWLDDASDEALCRLYGAADGVLFSSEDEGFGLPLAEAARYGKPILARSIPVYREIAGDHARYFSAGDADSMAANIAEWLDAVAEGRAPLSSNIRTATWAESARDICRALLGSSPSGGA